MTKAITNSNDVIDSREVIERVAELVEKRADEHMRGGERKELTTLEPLVEQGEDIVDWEYGVTLVRDSYFQDYARDLADDIGAIPNGVTWPLTCINWEQAARELQMDYTSVDFDGVTYWAR